MTSKQIGIRNWKPLSKNTLRGFFSVDLPSGMTIHNMMLHEKNNTRWVSFPSREYTDGQGEKQFARFIEFTDRHIADRFRDQVIEALDRHIADEEIPKKYKDPRQQNEVNR